MGIACLQAIRACAPIRFPRQQDHRSPAARSSKSDNFTANLSFEAKLWLAADKFRSNMDAGEYKHVVLGLIFLKYIFDTFEEHHAKLVAAKATMREQMQRIPTKT